METSNLIQVVVVGDDFGIDFAAQADEFGVDALDVVKIIIDDADFDVIVFLAKDDVEYNRSVSANDRQSGEGQSN